MTKVIATDFALPSAAQCLAWAGRKTATFARTETGAVSAEFIIILPVFILLFSLIASVAVLVVTASEVQQVSFELTRGSLRYYEPGIAPAILCSDVETRLVPDMVASGNFISADRFTHIGCAMDMSSGIPAMTVTVTYDMTNNPALAFAGFVGINVASFTRSSKMWF